MRKRLIIAIIAFLSFMLIFFTLNVTFFKRGNKTSVIIGAKNISESQILAEMIAILIEENSDLDIIRKYNLEGTFINFQAIKNGDIDIYVEYTGTALMAILKEKIIDDPKESYLFVKKAFLEKFDLVWLDPFGFENNYALVMLDKKAKKLEVSKISDLKKYDDLIFGFNPEFVSREEYKLLQKAYQLQWKKRPKIMDHTLLYLSLANESIDVINGFTTDANILFYDLKILKDDKRVFPAYAAAPIVRGDLLKRYPYLEDIINRLSGKITREDMQKMNYEVDYMGKSARQVADKFLEEHYIR